MVVQMNKAHKSSQESHLAAASFINHQQKMIFSGWPSGAL
jgi:hypothetical protein